MEVNIPQRCNGKSLPDIILLTQCYQYYQYLCLYVPLPLPTFSSSIDLSLQPMFPLKRFDIFIPDWVLRFILDFLYIDFPSFVRFYLLGQFLAAFSSVVLWVGPMRACAVVVVDSHIQRIVLATEETTVTQQVSHRPIKRQSRLWSQRGTKVNGSHHGDNPLLRPTGIQIATKSYAALQAMAPTNIKTVHQTSLLHSRATSIDSECCRLPTTSVLSKKPEKLRSNQF